MQPSAPGLQGRPVSLSTPVKGEKMNWITILLQKHGVETQYKNLVVKHSTNSESLEAPPNHINSLLHRSISERSIELK